MEHGFAPSRRQGARRPNSTALPRYGGRRTGNSRGETALHHAARAGFGDVVSLLIKLAQAPDGPGAAQLLLRKNHGGDTALHVAARRGRQAVAEVLMVAAPALSSVVNNAGMSPLYLAVTSRSIDTVKALIYRDHTSASAPTYWQYTSASGPKMQTALHAAVLQCKGELCGAGD